MISPHRLIKIDEKKINLGWKGLEKSQFQIKFSRICSQRCTTLKISEVYLTNNMI